MQVFPLFVALVFFSSTGLPLYGQGLNEMLGKANDLSDTGQYAEAEAMYKKIVELGGNKGITYFNLANLYFRQEKIDQAAIYYKKVIDNAPLFKNAYLNLGKIYYLVEDYKRAFATFNAYNLLVGGDYDTLILLGSTVQVLRDYTSAMRYFERAQNVNSTSAEIHVLMAQLYRELGDLERAVEFLTAAEFIVDDATALYRIKGEMLMDAEAYEDAASAFSAALTTDRLQTEESGKALLSDTDRYNISIQIAEAFERGGLPNVAIFELKRVVELFPSENEAISYLEFLLVSEGREQEAFAFFKDIYSENTDMKQTFRNLLARAYNSNDEDMMQNILAFYDAKSLSDEYSVLVKNYLLEQENFGRP